MRNLFRNSRRICERGRTVRLHLEALEDRTLLSAQLFTVNVATDTSSNGVGTGTTGDLRYCINQADMPDNAGSTIQFSKSLRGKTITLTQGELQITDNMTIKGLGASQIAVSGNDQSRVFDINSNAANVTISGLTISQGNATNTKDYATFGGGILNQGILNLTNDVLSNNKAVGVTGDTVERHLGGGAGGGVANLNILNVTGSTFIDNQALGANGNNGDSLTKTGPSTVFFPGLGIGGGLLNLLSGTATVTDSHFIDNVAQGGNNNTGTFAGVGQGGAIYNDNRLTVTRTSFDGNRAIGGNNNHSDLYSGLGVGGAISSGTNEALISNPNQAVLNVSQCTFNNNQAVGGDNNSVGPPLRAAGLSDGFGGGIFVFQGSATIGQSGLYHNLAEGGAGGGSQNGSLGIGGGIFFFNFLGPVTANVQNCAIVANEALGGGQGTSASQGGDALGGGLAASGMGLKSVTPGSVTVTNTLLSGNIAQGGQGGSSFNGGNGQGGGIFNDALSKLTATADLILLNSAVGGDGGNGGNGQGGGLFNGGAATLSKTIIAFNNAEGGGADSSGSGGVSQGGGVYNDAAAGASLSENLTSIFFNKPDNRYDS